MPNKNQAEYRRKRRAEGKDIDLRARKTGRKINPDPKPAAQQRKDFREQCKTEAFSQYGGKCYCCGETERLLLGLDHIAGNGNIHRKEIKHERLCVWARRNNWPPIFRVACHSCNLGSHLNGGICPHQKKEAHNDNL